MNPPNILDVFNFLDIEKRKLVAGYDILQVDSESVSVRHVVLIGIVMALGSMREALNILCEMDPKLEVVRERFADDVNRWQRLRHDMAHVFERVFSTPKNGANVPWTSYGLRVGGYEKETDEIGTGESADARFKLWKAIETVFELTQLAQAVHHDRAAHPFNKYDRPIADEIRSVRVIIGGERRRPEPNT